MRHLALSASGLALALSGCSSYGGPPPPNYPPVASAAADLRDPYGRSMGTATITQVGEGLRLAIQGMNLSPGAHGFHIHQTGVCAPPDFTSAGPHWNPTNRQHGKDNPAGMHHGDLPNLLIGADGRGSLEYTIPVARLSGARGALLDADGASLVIHAAADDYRTDPSGNSGARIACGVFR
ncbi:MAG TPA: superoxide dismutase family protein [Allosphingosinicella sp.]|nr:superoxide dismutase family protein [Allosphingosinicella sp.]